MLTNLRSDRIKAVRAAGRRSVRRAQGVVLVEGPQAVREAARAGLVSELYITEEQADKHPEIAEAAAAHAVKVQLASPPYVHAISPDAQGVVALANWCPAGLESLTDNTGTRDPARLVAILEQVRDPGNAGTIIRAADAAGADAIVLTDKSVDATAPKVIRASAGSVFHLPVIQGASVGATVSALRSQGLQALAADAAATVILNAPAARGEGAGDSVDFAAPTAWIFGNEAQGVSAEASALADARVRIEMWGQAESLNVAMAATLCLFGSASAMQGAR